MKKLILSIILSGVFFIFNIFSQDGFKYREVPNNAFGYSERLSFEVSYSFLTAAEAYFSVSPAPVTINGRDAYEVNFSANSRSSFDMVYKVRDEYKSYIDIKGLFTWKYEQHIREKNYNKDFEVDFMQDSQKVITKSNGGDQKSYTVPSYVQDLISAFYYARTLDWSNKNDGDKVIIPFFSDDKSIDLNIIFQGREEVEVAAGKFRTFIVKPELKSGFTSKTSDIYIWLSDDDRKIPVKVEMKIVIGALVAELTDYSGLSGPLNAKIQ